MKRKRKLLAVLAGIAAAGTVGASAATLGGLSGATLGAEDQVVAGCDTDGITVGYTTGYVAANQRYEVSALNFTDVASACDGKAASVTLRQGTTELATAAVPSITVTGDAFSITLSANVPAASVTGLSLIISG